MCAPTCFWGAQTAGELGLNLKKKPRYNFGTSEGKIEWSFRP